MTQGKLKTLLQPHSSQGCSSQPTQMQSSEEGTAESIFTLPASHPGGQDGRGGPPRGHAPTRGRPEVLSRLCREPGVPGRGLRCVHKVSGLRDPSANQPVFSWVGQLYLRRMCTSPRSTFSQNPCSLSTLSCSSAAAGQPMRIPSPHQLQTPNWEEREAVREGTRKGGACLLWFRDLPGGPVAKIPCAQGRGPGFDH